MDRNAPDGAPARPGAAKADFGSLYDRHAPRALARALGALDYEIPQRALPVFRALLDAMPRDRAPATDDAGRAQRVVDLCCSYGFNAALLRHDLTLAELMRHWSGPVADPAAQHDEPGPGDPDTGDLGDDVDGDRHAGAADAAFFAARRRAGAPRVVGLDAAGNAVAYARRAGLLDAGWAEDLESQEPSESLASGLADADLVTITGGVGYVTEKTFARVVPPGSHAPWVAAFVLRVFGYDRIEAVLADRGLVTERWEGGTFPQRRFADEREARATVRDLAARGLDPAGEEETGRYYADLFVSRPAADAARRSLADVLEGVDTAVTLPRG